MSFFSRSNRYLFNGNELDIFVIPYQMNSERPVGFRGKYFSPCNTIVYRS